MIYVYNVQKTVSNNTYNIFMTHSTKMVYTVNQRRFEIFRGTYKNIKIRKSQRLHCRKFRTQIQVLLEIRDVHSTPRKFSLAS